MGEAAVALVTGANKGLGKETARQLASAGMTVLAGSRKPSHGDRAARDLASTGVTVTPAQLDVTDPASIANIADQLARDHGRLDVLVNNAGTVAPAPATEVTVEQMRQVFEVNVFGVLGTINALLPLLRTAVAPRIVNVSSTTASLTLTSDGTDFGGSTDQRLAYTSSKAALNMLTVQYAQIFTSDPDLSHIKINSATPGYTATDLTDHRGTRSVEQGARIIVDLANRADGATGGFYNDQGSVPW